jgi:RHS repeat-associated protein
VSDGTRTPVWNARNELVRIVAADGAVIASFTYDALGRRQSRVVDNVARSYVHDGARVVQELAGATLDNSDLANVSASYVGAEIDALFARTSGTGSSVQVLTFLADADGSTIRLADAAGNAVADYTYDPYGNTTVDAAVDNAFQYTGRENDGTGLYYYRSRYYSPQMHRFISSDPIGLGGGINTHAYVGGDPISRTDPYGLDWFRDWNDTSTPYTVGREGTIVPPGGAISKFIEHCVPAGRTFGEMHDAKVEKLTSGGVPDAKANIPAMPGAYADADMAEGGKSMGKLPGNLAKLGGYSTPAGR